MFDPLYIEARRALLDVLDALQPQLDAMILVGAQAIYMHVGDAELAVSPYTTDADIALDPRLLESDPRLGDALLNAGFILANDGALVGTWQTPANYLHPIPIDFMVPEALSAGGRRAARLGIHGERTARKARGLEAAVVDKDRMLIQSLDPLDSRRHELWVAGVGALVVAKIHKIAERIDNLTRSNDKDALDVYRLLREIPTQRLGDSLLSLRKNELSSEVTTEAIAYLKDLFGKPNAPGCQRVGRAVDVLEDPTEYALSCAFLTEDLLEFMDKNGA